MFYEQNSVCDTLTFTITGDQNRGPCIENIDRYLRKNSPDRYLTIVPARIIESQSNPVLNHELSILNFYNGDILIMSLLTLSRKRIRVGCLNCLWPVLKLILEILCPDKIFIKTNSWQIL